MPPKKLLSFDDEPTESFTIKKKRNDTVLQFVEQEKLRHDLNELKRNQRTIHSKSTFPTQKEIDQIKQKRQQRLNADLIPLQNKIQQYDESRLVKEEQTEMEFFEDYNQDMIVFGPESTKRVKDLERLEMETAFEQPIDESDAYWELQKLKSGNQKYKPEIVIETTILPIPEKADLLNVDQLCDSIELLFQDMKSQQLQNLKHEQDLKQEIASYQRNLVDMESQLNGLSARYDYYQEFQMFVSNFSDFVESKNLEMVSVEKEYIDARVSQVMRSQAEKRLFLDELYLKWTGKDQRQPLPDQTEIMESDVFEDADESFGKLSNVKQKFEEWKFKQEKDYRQAYGALSLKDIFDIFVRKELLFWDPFADQDFSQTEWHSELQSFANVDGERPLEEEANLIQTLVERSLMPLITRRAKMINLYSTDTIQHCVQLLRQLEDYLSVKSPPFQRLLKQLDLVLQDQLYSLIQHYTVQETVDPKPRQLWMESVLQILKNCVQLHKWIPSFDKVSVFLDWILVFIPNEPVFSSLAVFLSIVSITSPIVPDVHKTPQFFIKAMELGLDCLVAIKSYNQASILSKRIKSLS
ncbi:hypothetical protein EDD86DRAFT_245253 [Gorgonomyces haynaldii]|nr:hypothetical protein EDD86DRAFT_245253 [Gorgonomyces haynaldii]